MPIHRFHIGQTVFLTPSLGLNIPGGACIITKQLPEREGEYEYRVRSINEPHERVVRESQMKIRRGLGWRFTSLPQLLWRSGVMHFGHGNNKAAKTGAGKKLGSVIAAWLRSPSLPY